MSNHIIHFELHASDPQRAISFYSEVFGWEFPKLSDNPPYWSIQTSSDTNQGTGISGGLMQRQGEGPSEGAAINAFVCTLQVDSFDKIHETIISAGGKLAVPKLAIPGMGWQGFYKDPEDNIFGINQPDPNAK